MNKFWCTILLLFILEYGYSQIDDLVKGIISESASQNAVFGISVRDDDGRVIYELNASSRFIPASTLKLITTLSAHELLGGDFRFATILGYQGELLQDGTLRGDIILAGSGDPSLGSHELSESNGMSLFLDKVVSEIQRTGITCIDGEILVFDGIFDRKAIHPSWAWDDLTNYYASGAWGLNVHDNYYYLSFERSNQPQKNTKVVNINPEVPNLTIENEVVTGPINSGDNAYIYGNPYDDDRSVEGTIPPGSDEFRIKGAIPNPPLFAAFHIRNALDKSGIHSASYRTTTSLGENMVKIYNFSSPPISELVAHANAQSDNMYCEAFFKKLGSLHGNKGNFRTGVNVVKNHLQNLGLPLEEIHMEDGSGLSARNRISPNFMTAFLHAKKSTLGADRLKGLIPKVGKEGSVRNFLKGYTSQQHTWLKSGSINNVLAYSGMIKLSSGTHASIAVMANGHSSNRQMRRQMEAIIETIYQEL